VNIASRGVLPKEVCEGLKNPSAPLHGRHMPERRSLDRVGIRERRENPLSAAPRQAERGLGTLVSAVLAGDSIARLVRSLEPQLAQNRRLRAALARHRAPAADTSLGDLPAGQFLWPGGEYDSLQGLARTLVALGDLAPDSAPPGIAYEGPVVDAVRRFQQRHALAADGVLGPGTLAALNEPVSEPVRRIELALERLRWLPPIGSERFLVVNVPAFQLVAFDSALAAAPSLSMRVVVGHPPDRLTPLLFERLRYVEFLPYWNVPWSIQVGEILPRLEVNPGCLRNHDMELVTRRGRVVGDTITPALMTRLRRGELRVRQRPGPFNSLRSAETVSFGDTVERLLELLLAWCWGNASRRRATSERLSRETNRSDPTTAQPRRRWR
jgi:murein L,D-transpeptidase YcbB/YkuD